MVLSQTSLSQSKDNFRDSFIWCQTGAQYLMQMVLSPWSFYLPYKLVSASHYTETSILSAAIIVIKQGPWSSFPFVLLLSFYAYIPIIVFGILLTDKQLSLLQTFQSNVLIFSSFKTFFLQILRFSLTGKHKQFYQVFPDFNISTNQKAKHLLPLVNDIETHDFTNANYHGQDKPSVLFCCGIERKSLHQ